MGPAMTGVAGLERTMRTVAAPRDPEAQSPSVDRKASEDDRLASPEIALTAAGLRYSATMCGG
jgi:hypothetical protein